MKDCERIKEESLCGVGGLNEKKGETRRCNVHYVVKWAMWVVIDGRLQDLRKDAKLNGN